MKKAILPFFKCNKMLHNSWIIIFDRMYVLSQNRKIDNLCGKGKFHVDAMMVVM